MSDSELGGANTPVSSGTSSASTTTTASSVAGTTPKLKLTFKLAEIRAASPLPPNAGVISANKAGSNELSGGPEMAVTVGSETRKPRRPTKKEVASSFVTPYKRARKEAGSTGGSSTAGPTPTSKEPALPSSTTTTTASPGGASSRVQFPEQITFVREMKKVRVGRWRRESTTVPLLGGRSLSLPCWARDRSSALSGLTSSTSGSPKTRTTDGSSAAFAPTFVCTWEGCHKIFDAKIKWRRHLNLHRRKESKAAASALESRGASPVDAEVAQKGGASGRNLQLKLNLGNLLRKASSATNVADAAVEPPTPDSSALDDVDIS